MRAPRWLPEDQLQQHAHRTAAYAEGQLSELQLVTLPDDILSLIDKVL